MSSWKKWVFKSFLKEVTPSHAFKYCGRAFQSLGPAKKQPSQRSSCGLWALSDGAWPQNTESTKVCSHLASIPSRTDPHHEEIWISGVEFYVQLYMLEGTSINLSIWASSDLISVAYHLSNSGSIIFDLPWFMNVTIWYYK